jgi:hypothetical protein
LADNQRSVLVRGKASIRRGIAALSGKAPRNMHVPNVPFNLTGLPFEPSGSRKRLISAETEPGTAKSAKRGQVEGWCPDSEVRIIVQQPTACAVRPSFSFAQHPNHTFKLRAGQLHAFDRDATVRIESAEQANWGAPTDAAAMVGKLRDRDF